MNHAVVTKWKNDEIFYYDRDMECDRWSGMRLVISQISLTLQEEGGTVHGDRIEFKSLEIILASSVMLGRANNYSIL